MTSGEEWPSDASTLPYNGYKYIHMLITGFPLFYWQKKNPGLFQDPQEKFSRTFSEPANV